MFPSCSRVKLNRVALKDVIRLPLVPRRRRNKSLDGSKNPEDRAAEPTLWSDTKEPVQAFSGGQSAPESVSDIPEGDVEARCPQKNGMRPAEGSSRQSNVEVKRTGSCNGGKYQSQGQVCGALCTLRFSHCVCADSACKFWRKRERQTAGEREVSCRCVQQMERIGNKTRSQSKQTAFGKRFGVRQGNAGEKMTRPGEDGGPRSHEVRKQRRTERDVQPAPGAWPLPPAAITRIDRSGNTRPNATGLDVSEGSVRRAVRASGCGLCGDCKYSSSQRKLGKQRRKTTIPEQPKINIKKENTVTATPQKIVVWIDRYPKVTLCDVAQKCDSCSHHCAYEVPDVLKTKDVYCFKQDVNTGVRFEPSCSGLNKQREESSLVKSSELCPVTQFEKSVSLCLNEHRIHLKENAVAETLSRHSPCHLVNDWTSEASASCPASFSLGKCTNMGECRTGIRDRGIEENPSLGSSTKTAEMCGVKRIKLVHRNKDTRLLPIPDIECSGPNDPAKTDTRDEEKICPGLSESQSGLESRVGSTNTSGLLEECENPCDSEKANGEHLLSELDSNMSEMSSQSSNEQETFSCQRVRVYQKQMRFTCARTYMPWPFSDKSQTSTAHSETTPCPSESIELPPRCNIDSQVNTHQPGSPSKQTNVSLLNAATDSCPGPTHRTNEEKEEDGGRLVSEKTEEDDGRGSLYTLNSKILECLPYSLGAELPQATPSSRTASISTPREERETDTAAALTCSFNGSEAEMLTSSAVGLSDWETAIDFASTSPTLSLCSFSCMAEPREKSGLNSEETHVTSCSSSTCDPAHNTLSVYSLESSQSSLLVPQEQAAEEETLKERGFSTEFLIEQPVGIGIDVSLLPVLLSPVTSPQKRTFTSVLPKALTSDEAKGGEMNKDEGKHQMLPGQQMPQIVNKIDSLGFSVGKGCLKNLHPEHQHEQNCNVVFSDFALREPQSSVNGVGDIDVDEEKNRNDTDYLEDMEQGNCNLAQVPSDPKMKATLSTGDLTESCSSLSHHKDDGSTFDDEDRPHSSREDGTDPSERAESETEEPIEMAEEPFIMDEVTAYEHDILLVDVVQDDPELFDNMPKENVLTMRLRDFGKPRPVGEVTTSRKDGASLEFEKRSIAVNKNFLCDSADIHEECESRPWRPRCGSVTFHKQSNTWTPTDKQIKSISQWDSNNNRVNGSLERSQPVQTTKSLHNVPPFMTIRNGSWHKNAANMIDFSGQKSNTTLPTLSGRRPYCWQYFSDSLTCGFKMCRFLHVPAEGDEKFCMDIVMQFTKTPLCLQKAGAVFTSYYQKNSPGTDFSMPVLTALFCALLKAGMISDLFSVLNVSLVHKIVPSDEFLLALFNVVREKGLFGYVPELMQLTFKMANAGLVLSLDYLECIKNMPEFQPNIQLNSTMPVVSGNHKLPLPSGAPFPEYLNFAQAILEIELCSKQEDWKRMGEVFKSICQTNHHPNRVERISGRIAVALLSKSKDKLSLPFASFAEIVCQNEGEGSIIKNFLGRVGVSLMLRYHKTRQWAKGRRVVEVMSSSKVNYSLLKGLFGNEDGASRCYLVTVATELFLLSGSVEGALNTLRDNNWFLSSCSWPCQPADLESRSRVLRHIAEQTSHRDTLEVLSNLPGLKEPNDLVDTSVYNTVFNTHLQVWVDRQILPVASDTVDFMLSKKLAVDYGLLQTLVHKLGKQNLWLRAREVFKHSLGAGYFPDVLAPPGFMALTVPSRLGEVMLALTFEMFITVNAAIIFKPADTSSCCLSITLKRTESCESEYLSAGSRLLSAARIPQPALIVHYTTVNASQEQVFTLDTVSARQWLRHNHLWAGELWAH